MVRISRWPPALADDTDPLPPRERRAQYVLLPDIEQLGHRCLPGISPLDLAEELGTVLFIALVARLGPRAPEFLDQEQVSVHPDDAERIRLHLYAVAGRPPDTWCEDVERWIPNVDALLPRGVARVDPLSD